MPVLTCPQCGSELELDADSAGGRVQCGACMHTFTTEFSKKSKQFSDHDGDEERPSKRERKRRFDEDEDEYRPRGRRKPTPINGLALASMICGIVGLVIEVPGCACCGIFSAVGGIPALVGLVLAIVSARSPQNKGFRITGLVTSIIAIVVGVLFVILGLIYGVALIGMNAAGPGGAGPGGPPAFRGGR